MTPIARALRAALLLALSLTAALAAHAQPSERHVTPRPPLPRPILVTPDLPAAALPLRIASMSIDATLAGRIAHTRIELLVENPNARVLEARLDFPLRDGQAVTGFALDIDGRLRSAVPVPKPKGRQVFEDVTRQQVDPALLQVTQGNNYSLRIYPVPPGGTRRVLLELTEPIERDERSKAAHSTWRLPLAFGQTVGDFRVTVAVVGEPNVRNLFARLGARALPVESQPDGRALIRDRQTAFDGADAIEVRRNGNEAPSVVTQAWRGKTYLLASLPLSGAERGTAPRPAPRTLGLVWDASGSGLSRDRARELALLDAYFRRVPNVAVLLSVVRDAAEPVERHEVRNGDWSALRRRLQQMVYDGATRGDLLAAPEGADLALLFSDGLANYGSGSIPAASLPLFAIHSSAAVDAAALRQRAEASGGEVIDLARRDVDDALRRLTMLHTRVVALDGNDVTELMTESRSTADGRVQVAGVLTRPTGTLRLQMQLADGRRIVREVAVSHRAETVGAGLAPQQWARLRLAELSAEGAQRRAQIERIGMHFHLPTPQTSLIVLEAPSDYARHGIEPPADEPVLVQAVERLLVQRRDSERQARATQLARVTREFRERIAWWEKPFPKDAPPLPAPLKSALPRGAATDAADAQLARDVAEERARREQRSEAQRMAPMPAAPSPAPPPVAAAPASKEAASTGASIALRKWQPDSTYARRMRAASGDAVYAAYLDERPGYTNSTAFFLDAADILLDRKQPALALRVLSNLAEMNLEDRHILRILAYRLRQQGEVALALPLLERVQALAPDEPQSWRDLALALDEAGEPQRAVEALWHVVAQPWHGRFPGIELIALTELNAVAAKAQARGVSLDLSSIPPELLRNLPVALRVVLAWDADNTDIDLWVTDPNGERAFYGRRLTHQGGLMSRDFTGGYGPEEFSLRDPKPGRYKVQAQFYGHRQQIVAPATTLMLQFVTGFGTPQEKRQNVVLRLSGAKDVVEIGEFVVGCEAEVAGTVAGSAACAQ